MAILGIEPLYFSSKKYWYHAILYSAVSEYGWWSVLFAISAFAAELVSHSCWKINECYFWF